MEKEETQGFVSRFTDLIDYLLPLYSKEARASWLSPWAAPAGITGPWPWPSTCATT